jgi:hypothetical protein
LAVNATVLVERIGKGKYRASTAQPIALASEGKSRADALRRLQRLACKRLSAGELVQVDFASGAVNPWKEFAGVWKDHPEFESFLADIVAYRRSKKD